MSLATGTTVIDNRLGQSQLDGGIAIDKLLTIPEGNWLQTGQLQLQLQIYFIVTTNVANAKSGTERFLNPSQLQLGHWATTIRDFVLNDGRIKYRNQAIIINSPLIPISSTRRDAPIRLSKTIFSKRDVFQGSGSMALCGNISGIQVPDAVPILNDVSIITPLNQLTGSITPGQSQYSQEDSLEVGVKQINIDTSLFGWPDSIQTTVWRGQQLEIVWSIEVVSADSTAEGIATSGFIVGDARELPYGYSCAFGQIVPALTNPLCEDTVLNYGPDGNGGFISSNACTGFLIP